ncbi:MAG: hypothetical protein CL927_02300 [Deltaproteobacteria bacterium]|nr:hypothetical protein [Deltaproteobacteria bacterium]HCH65308.1 hypothetical protein [Deltaproteobacteria bacterium]
MPANLRSPLARLQRIHERRRLLELFVRLFSGLGVGAMAGVALWPWTHAASLVAATGIIAYSAFVGRRIYLASRSSLDDIARLIDGKGETHDLIRTALCIITGRSVGSTALAEAIVAEAITRLPTVEHHADTPFRLPRSLPPALALMGLLWFVPSPESPLPTPSLFTEVTKEDPSVDANASLPRKPEAQRPDPTQGEAGARSERAATASGRDQTSSGGAETTSMEGLAGGAGDRAADGDVDAAEAEGAPAEGSGASSNTARAAGTSGVDAGSASSSAETPEAGQRSRAESLLPPEDAAGSGADRNTTGTVDQTKSVDDSVRSEQETITVADAVVDDRDAQTRAVAGTLDVQSDNPQFYDADEQSDGELNGDGGAGGWTVGLSQTGEGGVNDASGSTWKTEAGLADPPDWSDAPAEWVDAAWQDAPAGVVRRVKNGQSGGAGSAAYMAAWHRYAAVAESDTTTKTLSAGRRSLIRQYFIAIAPTESP